jgi:membrane protease YdiL (CAAX protease family)
LPDDRPVDDFADASGGGRDKRPRRIAGRHTVPGFDIRYWEVLAVLGASLGFALIVATVTGAVMGGLDPNRAKALAKSETFALTVLGLSTLGMFLWAYLIIVMRRRMSWRDFGFRRIGLRAGVLAFVLGLLAMPLMAVTGAGVQRILGRSLESPQLQFLAPDGFSWTIVVGMILIGGLLAPLAEEILFRGLLYGWLRRFMGLIPAALLSAAVFGLVHGMLPVMAAAFVVGLMLAYVYERTGSLWASAIVHATQNCLAMTIMFASLK